MKEKQGEFKSEELRMGAKTLLGRELELARVREELEQKIKELEAAKEREMVLRIREIAKAADIKRKVEELEKKTKELKEARKALLNILEDVDEARRKAEEERNKTLAIIANLTDGLLVFDSDNRVSLINSRAEEILGIKFEEIEGESISDLSRFSSLRPIIQLVEEREKIFREEVKLHENLILEITTSPITREKERIGSLLVLHDITREKRIERMKTEFVSVAAHQLRTPLSAIKWSLGMILAEDMGPLTQEQKAFLQKTYNSNERMINLVNDLLDVARIEEGRYIYKPAFCDLAKICQMVINSHKAIIKRKKIKFEFKKPKGKLPQIKLDEEKISLAIQNLLENAIRYTPPGGKIVVSLKRKKGEIEFSVKDTGIGIPKEQQDRLFTKFFRGTNAVRMETEGTGLGLFIAKNIIESHRGRIWAESEENKGSVFHFSLPIGLTSSSRK